MDTTLVKLSLKKAVPEDLKKDKSTLRFGQTYAIINGDGKTLSGLHIINEETDPMELAQFLEQERILVPMSCLDSKIEIV